MRKNSRNRFDPKATGLQIDWEEDQEVEFLGLAALKGEASCTAATCKRGASAISYLYPVEVRECTATRLELEYRVSPASWRPSWKWEVNPGSLIIDFRKDEARVPVRVSYRYSEDGDTENLKEGKDWIYRPPSRSVQVSISPRKKLATSRIERPGQQLLRHRLVSAHGACQISGTRSHMVLEACHIVPVKAGGDDVLENAILLRRDLHSLFDSGLLRFRSDNGSWLVEIDASIESDYGHLNGKRLSAFGSEISDSYLAARMQVE